MSKEVTKKVKKMMNKEEKEESAASPNDPLFMSDKICIDMLYNSRLSEYLVLLNSLY